ncbi:tail assembly chaperone [Streptococcus danieliae]|uniref:Phage protein n=1 Tax=Streptococcus danieliae TaxID=747656 RepID=A0A7Z0S4X0_9STRE|nr:tail assembly chaperone [Streptococcus danieliae]MBF0699680.1 hypothetical protein [Streptococcus danieliae]NYS96856.1 hypothetical protein [Streptococcus danieliae]
MEFTVGKSTVDIKFDYRAMFKIDKELGTRDPKTGNRNSDGIGSLFTKIIDRDDQGVVDLIVVMASKKGKAVSEEEAITAIEQYFEKSDTEDPQETLFQEIEEEMVESGFFKKKILKYIENLEKALAFYQAKVEQNPEDVELSLQVETIGATIGKMKSATS